MTYFLKILSKIELVLLEPIFTHELSKERIVGDSPSLYNTRALMSVSHVTMQGWLSLVVHVAMVVDPGISRMELLATVSAQAWTGLLPAVANWFENEEAENPTTK